MAKRAEDEAVVGEQQPNERMLYIGADYRMEQPDAPGVRGQDKSLARFEEIMTEWDKYPAGKLVPVLILQRTIGMSLFHGKFQLRARRYLNSMIRCLRGRNGDFRVVSKAFDTLERSKHWTAFHVAQTIFEGRGEYNVGAKQRCHRAAIAAKRRILSLRSSNVIAQRSLEERGDIYLPVM